MRSIDIFLGIDDNFGSFERKVCNWQLSKKDTCHLEPAPSLFGGKISLLTPATSHTQYIANISEDISEDILEENILEDSINTAKLFFKKTVKTTSA